MVTWNGQKIADSGFLINLVGRKDRLEESQQLLENLNIVGVERFDAIELSENDELHFLGCAESHKKIFEYQVSNNIKKMLIFEDDVNFDPHPIELNEYELSVLVSDTIRDVDFDLLYLGTVLSEKGETITDNLTRPKNTYQTTAYIIDIRLAEFALKNYDYRKTDSIFFKEQIDTFFSILQKKISWRGGDFPDFESVKNNNFNIFVLNPMIFNQRISYSDIQKRVSDTSIISKVKNLKYI